MANDTPALNGTQISEKVNGDKPAVTAKEPKVSTPMLYEPLPVKKANGSSSGTTNHTSHSTTQRRTNHSTTFLTFNADQSAVFQAPRSIRLTPKAGAYPVSPFQKTSRSQPFKKQSSQLGESLSPISMTLMMPTFIA